MHRPWFQFHTASGRPFITWLLLLSILATFAATSEAAAESAADKIQGESRAENRQEFCAYAKDYGAGQMRPPLPGDWSLKDRSVIIKPGSVRGAFVLKSGSRFPVALLQEINSDTARSGEQVEALLMAPLEYGGLILAPAGAKVAGRICNTMAQRTSLGAKISSRNWLNSSAAFTIYFEAIGAKTRLDICAQPAPDTVVLSSNKNLPLKVSKNGSIVLPFNGLPHIATSVAITGLSLATGPFSLIAGPVLSTTASVISPSFGLDRPVPDATTGERLRAAATGAVKGLPGGFLVSGVVNHGLDFKIPAGTEITVELRKDLIIDAASVEPGHTEIPPH